MEEFKRIVIGNNSYNALRFGPDEYSIPQHIMQNTRQDGIRITDNDIYPFPWLGITKDTTGQYILFPDTELESITTLSTKYRSKSLSLIRKIALGLQTSNKAFLDLENGIFPLYRIYIEGGNNIVLLPPDCANIISLSRTTDEKDKDIRYLVKPDTEKGFTLIMEMAELLYYSISGVFPYEKREVRESGFKEIPLQIYDNNIETELLSFITKILNMKVSSQRKICGNRECQNNLSYFLNLSQSINYSYPNRKESDRVYDVTNSENSTLYNSLFRKKEKKAAFLSFLRHKGVTIFVIAFVSSIFLYLVGNYLYQTFKPPVTKDLTPVGIIEHLIDCQNELDASNLDEGFKKSSAQSYDVTTLYVLSQTRKAYESITPVTSAPTWIENGREPIDKDSIIYGAIISDIIDKGNEEYKAKLIWYTPYAINEIDEEIYEEKENKFRLFIYSIDEDFTFVWNKRGWWECSSSVLSNEKLEEVVYVDYK